MTYNKDEALVSILIPTYNREKYIAEALDSALAQTYENIEIIVSDNASTDRTVDIVNEYIKRDARIRLFQNEENVGPVLNWKVCLDQACGVYSKILWSDDLIAPDYLVKTIGLFEEEGELAFVFTKVQVGETLNKIESTLYNAFETTGIYPSSDFVNGIMQQAPLPCSPGCAIFKTKVLKNSFVMENDLFVNRYLENGAGPDLLMFLMAARLVPMFGYISDPLSFFRDHAASITIASDSQQLGLDYARAIIWYLYHFEGKEMAVRYWVYTFKKKKLYRNKDRTLLRGFLFLDQVMRRSVGQHFYLFISCWCLRSKQYLKAIQYNGV